MCQEQGADDTGMLGLLPCSQSYMHCAHRSSKTYKPAGWTILYQVSATPSVPGCRAG